MSPSSKMLSFPSFLSARGEKSMVKDEDALRLYDANHPGKAVRDFQDLLKDMESESDRQKGLSGMLQLSTIIIETTEIGRVQSSTSYSYQCIPRKKGVISLDIKMSIYRGHFFVCTTTASNRFCQYYSPLVLVMEGSRTVGLLLHEFYHYHS
jgi:hypothetical protein